MAGGKVLFALAGEGPPLILLHGWTLDHRMWQPQVAALAKDFLLVMPDRRGCGGSTAPPDLGQEAADVITIADFLGFDRFGLLGLSQGAVVALDVARKFSSRLAGLVVSGAPLPCLVTRDETIDLDRYRAMAAAGDMASMRAEWARHQLMRTHTPEARALAMAILEDYHGRDLQFASEPPGLPREVLEHLPVPVLALAGEHDTPWRRECAAALADCAPRGRHNLIARAGHLANCDNPKDFNTLAGSFLQTCADPSKRPSR
ncbi:MAG: pimeloyl-[acyl-carrier protein] methyl ester esterase BioH [Porphyrobacter sp. HL-46]|nr:MAG: pimeloyl-[acyl-carrier protein] methyl ester esterase BioH [Porphyrobacter sp. HL-46]